TMTNRVDSRREMYINRNGNATIRKNNNANSRGNSNRETAGNNNRAKQPDRSGVTNRGSRSTETRATTRENVQRNPQRTATQRGQASAPRSEEHTSELQ